MMRHWIGRGPAFSLEWGGRTWTLKVDDPRPGLIPHEVGQGPLLGLEGLAEVGRWAPSALSGSTLIGFECRHGRVEATYAPLGWGALFVRAAWSPSGADGVDLEVQVWALSVDRLKRVEVKLVSVLGPPAPTTRWIVHPRDARSAGLSDDGREPDRLGLITAPPVGLSPRPPEPFTCGNRSYLEMVHPEDASRRIVSDPPTTIRHGLFGHDLEKGVVLRARLRGLWLPEPTSSGEVAERFQQFLREPPPLMT